MKVVVQNGARHWLSRRDAEAVIAQLPESWSNDVRRVALVRGEDVSTYFHSQSRSLSLYSPSYEESEVDKPAAVSFLLHGLANAIGRTLPDGLESRCRELVQPKVRQ